MGRFHEQVSRYLDVFPAEQVRVVWFRDWVADPRSTYLGILKFLGLEDDGRTDFPRVNQGLSFRSPRLINLLYRPPASVRRIARLFKRVTGLQAGTQEKLVEKTARLLAARGYKNKISPELADEIRRHFADDNRHLNKLLGSAGVLLKSDDQS
jgi:hypothetical protein